MKYSISGRLCAIFLFVTVVSHAQQPDNPIQSQGYVTVTLPKTPESAGFEQFGKTPVNELTGTPDISIPIYTLKGRYLQVPITLSYQSNGIKVNQESSWVGLGFDLMAGGRITVETKGSADFSTFTNGLYSRSNLAAGMQKLVHRLGDTSNLGILTYASICPGCDTSLTHNLPDDAQTVWDMTQFGAGQPDIFRANFMGHSLTYYVDKISGGLKWLGEQSQFSVNYTLDSINNISGWTIKDNDGITYYFNTVETTSVTLPQSASIPGTSTSAWLLSMIVHPQGDTVKFTYANYGSTYPAFNWSSSITTVWPTGTPVQSNDAYQNLVTQSPNYLTKVETSDMSVDFVLSNRTDLYGAGAKKLDSIKISDKRTGTIWKKAAFAYSYFNSGTDPCHSYISVVNLPSGQLACSNVRLRLDSLSINAQSYQPPYRFYYNGTPPDKYSFAQDHWGYANASSSNGSYCAPKWMLPTTGTGTTINNSGLGGNGAFRDCDSASMLKGILDTIVYPTGGMSTFVFEPHFSRMPGEIPITGGGLRIKSMKDYSMGRLASSVDYSYNDGRCMGILKYHTVFDKMPTCSAGSGNDVTYDNETINGYMNDNELQVAYRSVTIIQHNAAGQTNGWVVKTFNVPTLNLQGFNDVYAHWPTNTDPVTGLPNNTEFRQYDAYAGFPPTAAGNLDGKLLEEQYYDSLGTLVKSVNYYYHQANFSQNLFDVRSIDNTYPCSQGYSHYYELNGNRAYLIFVAPAKTFTTLTDSVVETIYQGASSLTQRKAYTYNAYYMLQTMTTSNSDGTQTAVAYKYPYDYSAGTNVYFLMTAAHILSPVISTGVTRNSSPASFTMNNYMTYGGLYVPQNTQVQVASNTIETRQLYNAFDVFGHLMEVQKPNGRKEDYIWGYNHRFPVAQVVGSDSGSIAALVSATIINSPSSDSALRVELNKLRTTLTSALVTTFTYNAIGELTSTTDPRGVTNYYEYDGYGRLKWIKDKDGNILKATQYHYQSIPGVQY